MFSYHILPIVEFALLIFSFCYTNSVSTQFTNDRKRVGPLDLVMAEHDCLKTFTVSENTIIRTQDSRLLGAKFINVSGVGNREDCLSFCCNTRFCDVAVFQEKSPFSCYLFDCGPPEEFLCKFTSHTYYTSAVLAVNRHQLDLGVWSSQYQHEAELTDLRAPPEASNIQAPSQSKVNVQPPTTQLETEPTTTTTLKTTTTASTTITTTLPPQTSLLSAAKSQNARKCSNFQFECHSGECIAIYNACDGIPQCHDSSDEGAELGCPQGTDRGGGTGGAGGVGGVGGGGVYNHHSSILEYNHYANDASPDYPREDGLGYSGHGKGPGYFDYNLRGSQQQPKYNLGHQDMITGDSASLYHHEYPDYGGLIGRQRELQLPSPNLRQQQMVPLQTEQQIKTIPLKNQPPPQMYQHQQHELSNDPMWQRSNQRYPLYQTETQQSMKQGHRFGEPIREQLHQGFIQGRKGSNSQPFANSRIENARMQGSDMVPNQERVHQQYHNYKEDQQPSGDIMNPISTDSNKPLISGDMRGSKTMAETDLTALSRTGETPPNRANIDYSSSDTAKINEKQRNGNVSQPQKSATKDQGVTGGSGHAPSNDETKSTAKTKSSDFVVAHSSISHLAVDIAELKLEEEDQKSQTSGAILALSLGMCITALLIVLVGCRIRGVKRRVRRRRGLRSPLEHDADYLVNGMYL